MLKCEKDYIIGAEVLIEIDCLLLLGMITNYTIPEVLIEIDCLLLLGMITNYNIPDIDMLRWIAYIKSLNLEFKPIVGRENLIADMMSRASYDDDEEMVFENEDVGTDFYSNATMDMNAMYLHLSNFLRMNMEEIGCK